MVLFNQPPTPWPSWWLSWLLKSFISFAYFWTWYKCCPTFCSLGGVWFITLIMFVRFIYIMGYSYRLPILFAEQYFSGHIFQKVPLFHIILLSLFLWIISSFWQLGMLLPWTFCTCLLEMGSFPLSINLHVYLKVCQILSSVFLCLHLVVLPAPPTCTHEVMGHNGPY